MSRNATGAKRSRYAPNPNRTRQIRAVSGLDRALSKAIAPDFTGSVTVFVPVKNGRLGEPSFDVKRFGEPP